MTVSQHAAVSIALSGGVWYFLSLPAAIACFLAGVFIDLDHLFDYVLNYGIRLRPRHFFRAFEHELFDNLVIFLHSWEWMAVFLVILWLTAWKPVAVGVFIGLVMHLLLDNVYNNHSVLAYFFTYRLRHGFSARHYYGAREYRRRLRQARRHNRPAP